MQFKTVFLVLFGVLSSACSAPREGLPLLSPGGIGGIFEGPNDVTIIKGPDGSEITSEQRGGVVISDDGLEAQPIVVAETILAPILSEERLVSTNSIISSTGAPILVSANQGIASPDNILASQSTPLLTGEIWAESASDALTGYEESLIVPALPESSIINPKPIEIVQEDPHIIETEFIEASDIEPVQSADLHGPSGRIITKGSASIVSGPASTTITEPRKIIVAPQRIAIGSSVNAEATIPLSELSLAAPLPSIPPLQADLRYSATADPIEYGYSTTRTPLVDGSLREDVRSTRIDLGVNDLRQSIPVVEYSSLNGVINEPAFLNDRSLSTTESYIVSGNLETGDLSQNEIISFDPRKQYLSSPDLSQSDYIAPALARNDIDISQVNLAQVPLSQVTRLSDGNYHEHDPRYLRTTIY